MENIIIVAVLAVVIGIAARYLYKAKKRGAVCIGCPSGGCSGHCACGNEADGHHACNGACHHQEPTHE